jgi:hypothetical protein
MGYQLRHGKLELMELGPPVAGSKLVQLEQ